MTSEIVLAAGTLIQLALEEDLGLAGPPWLRGDVTGSACVQPGAQGRAYIEARQSGVLCGLPLVEEVFNRVRDSEELHCRLLCTDGESVASGERLVELEGSLRAILAGERTALNFLQRLSGIATASAELAALARGRVRVLDTRKTMPGWRKLEKLAVRTGGAGNHRAGLHDMYLIKENHIAAAGGITAALDAARRHREALGRPEMAIEIEVESLMQLEEALAAGATRIMLDNFTPPEVDSAVEMARGLAELEVSGGVRAETLETWCRAGVDMISVGAMTHSVKAFDCSLLVEGGK